MCSCSFYVVVFTILLLVAFDRARIDAPIVLVY
jgi:hypothetical protein